MVHSLLHPVGHGENRRKVRRLMDEDEDSLTGGAKAACTSKAKKERIYYFPSSSKCLAASWKAGASAC